MANWGIKLKTITPQSGVKTSSVLLFRRSENKNKKTQGLNYSRAAHVKFASILFEIESESLKKKRVSHRLYDLCSTWFLPEPFLTFSWGFFGFTVCSLMALHPRWLLQVITGYYRLQTSLFCTDFLLLWQRRVSSTLPLTLQHWLKQFDSLTPPPPTNQEHEQRFTCAVRTNQS